MYDFHKLKIWRRSVALAAAVTSALRVRYSASPGLISQLTRACNSVHANIAEGGSKSTPRHAAHCLDIAVGELNEAESYLTQASAQRSLEYQLANQFINEVQEIRRMTICYKRWVLRNEK